MTTTTPSLADEQRAARTLDSYRDALLSERAGFSGVSARSRTGYQPPITRSDYSHAMRVLAEMARESDPLARIASRIIGKVNLYGDASQAEAAIRDAAGAAVAEGYTDVIRLASPEPGRRSDAKRAYTLRERIVLACWITAACRPFITSVYGIGWCLEDLARQHRVDAKRILKAGE